MGDTLSYIFIIGAIVVWVVSKIAKATKAADTSTTPPPMSSTNKKSLEDWWKELAKEVQPAPQPITVQKDSNKRKTQTATNKPIDSVNPNYFEDLRKNYKNAEFSLQHKPLQHLEVIESFDDGHSAYNPLNINLKTAGEARRALVYSEIFNRKY
ncbi:MAG: hypothetical protein LBB41_00335 [Prevotellaceae bacterium]|jgi:hypothetical protein|nr:hypothetical protein [Prevotellaceae bacterium]